MVFVTFQSETGVGMRTEATPAQTRNKLLYCTLIDLPKPGHWRMTLLVVHAAERIEFVSDLGQPTSITAHRKLEVHCLSFHDRDPVHLPTGSR
jgi:hypothetical protein